MCLVGLGNFNSYMELICIQTRDAMAWSSPLSLLGDDDHLSNAVCTDQMAVAGW